jgi:hypothetical protein
MFLLEAYKIPMHVPGFSNGPPCLTFPQSRLSRSASPSSVNSEKMVLLVSGYSRTAGPSVGLCHLSVDMRGTSAPVSLNCHLCDQSIVRG